MVPGETRHHRLNVSVRLICILALLVAALGMFAVQAPARANDGPSEIGNFSLPRPEKSSALAASTLDSHLQQLVAQIGERPATSIVRDAPISRGETVAVSIYFTDDSATVRDALTAQGAEIANEGEGGVEAYVPLAALQAVGEIAGVERVATIVPPVADVTSQGTTVHNSPAWNVAGYGGAGVKVGVIDGGFSGYGSLIGSELPVPAGVRCYTAVGAVTSNIADCEAGGEVHGTAVAETIVDIAPDVTLYLAQPQTMGDLQTTVDWMFSQGVTVINHSVSWPWTGPGDGTSPYWDSPLATVDAAVESNIIWVNSAGNSANNGWIGAAVDNDADSLLDYYSDDLPANECQQTYVEAGTTMVVQMRWADSWSAAASDNDLWVLKVNDDETAWETFPGSVSQDTQDGTPGGVPYEIVVVEAPVTNWYCIAMTHYDGDMPAWVQVQTFRQQLESFADPVRATTVTSPAESANPGMLAVGAANWQTTSTIEEFSSLGPTTDGRIKPDIVGADAADTVSYGPNGFSGTSQASPHVAGLAALVRQRFPDYTPQQTAEYLKTNASPRDTAPNNTWGAGFALLPAVDSDTTPPTTSAPKDIIAGRRQLRPTTAGGTTTYQARVAVSWTSPDSDVDHFELKLSSDNGSTWTSVPLAHPTDTSVQTYIPFGKFVKFRVRAVDTAGNVGVWKTRSSGTLAGRQETHASISYTGPWVGPSPLLGSYGGKVKNAGIAGRTATITFTGKQFAWVSTVGPSRGKAEVWMNGNKLATVDLYVATEKRRMVVFARNWSTSATRTIEIRVLGQRTAPSTGNRVDIDGYLFR